MPSRPSWYLERDAIATFLRGWPLAPGRRWRLLPTSANAQPAVAEYTWDETAQAFLPQAITLLTLGRSGGEEITAFLNPELFPRFGLRTRRAGLRTRRLALRRLGAQTAQEVHDRLRPPEGVGTRYSRRAKVSWARGAVGSPGTYFRRRIRVTRVWFYSRIR
jgi:hypothetical protein